uniref:SIAH-type domain-containing protein n=1 Tax=Photinus pyralis TaxID=7054 RepID=A0A1Y1MF07_PHOPY
MSSNSLVYDLPSDVVNTLLCSVCDGYLSCGPVTEDNGKLICGRCYKKDTVAVLQVAYEKAMSNFIFPCRFDKQGCKERLLFNSIIEHERKCRYRTLDCPSLLCVSSLLALELQTHFEEYHRELINNDGQFRINLNENARCNLLMVHDDITVIIKYLYDSSTICLQIEIAYTSNEEESIYYKLQIISGTDSDNSLNLSQQLCSLYETRDIDVAKCIKLEMKEYLGVLANPPSLVFKVSITLIVNSDENHVHKPATVSNINTLSNILHEELVNLEWLRCNNCRLLVSPPLYFTDSDVSLCGACCEGHTGVHESTLSTSTNFSCCWRGCPFLGNLADISVHIETCKFKTYLCPFYTSCENRIFNYNESQLFIRHLKIHATYCSPDRILVELFNRNASSTGNVIEKSYFTNIGDKVVLFTCAITTKGDKWSLNSILPSGVNVKIMFAHEHCRLRSASHYYNKYRVVNINNDDETVGFPLCFKEYYRLTAIITFIE